MGRPIGKLSLLSILLFWTACTKKNSVLSNHTSPASIVGEWNVISDSTFHGGPSNYPLGYTGQTGDYFEFTTDGQVYTREGMVMNTLTYLMVGDSAIVISDFGLILNGVPDTSAVTGLSPITSLNPQIIVIESPLFLTPGGEFWRKATLSR